MRFGLGHLGDVEGDTNDAGELDSTVESDGDGSGDADADADVDVPPELEGCVHPTVEETVIVQGEPTSGSELTMVAAGGELALAWVGDVSGTDEVFFTVVGEDGAAHIAPMLVSPDDGATSWAPSVAELGDGFAVAYADARGEMPQAYLRVVTEAGAGIETRLPDVETYADHWSVDLVSGDEGLGAAWHDGHDVFFAAIETDGQRAGAVTQVTNDPWILEPLETAYGAGAYSIVWTDSRDNYDVLYGRVSWSGEKLVAPLPIASAPGESVSPSLCFDGVSFILLWIDGRGASDVLMIARLDPDGTLLHGPVVVLRDHAPDMARIFCTGFDYGVAWVEAGSLFFASLDEAFETRAPEVMVSAPEGPVDAFALAWNGHGYSVATIEDADDIPETLEVTTRAISCGP